MEGILNGNISQVGLWNEELTADEVSSLYNHGLPIDLTTDQAAYESSSNLVGYWRMGSGTLDNYPSIGSLTYGVIADQTNATLGDELIVNGDFATDSNWNKGTGWTISNGKARRDGVAAGGNSPITQTVNLVAGKVYKVSYDRTYISNGGETNLYSEFFTDGSFTTLGSYNDTTQETVTITSYFSPTYTGTMPLNMYGIGTFTGTVDNVSLKEFGGNPAIMHNMFTNDIENGSPYANLVQNGTFDTDTNWTKGTGWTIANGKANATSASSDLFQIGVPFSLNKTYKLTYTISNYSQGNTRSILGGYIFGSTRNTNGTFTDILTPTNGSSNSYVYIEGQNSFTGSIDNVTVEEVNTGLQGYWKMGDGTNDEYPYIYDQVDPTLGSELVTNGDFSNGTTDWNSIIYNSTLSIVGGQMKIVSTITLGRVIQAITTEIGKTYLINATLTNIDSSTGIQFKVSNSSNLDSAYFNSAFNTTTSPVTITDTFVATATTTYIGTSQGTTVGQSALLDNVSVKQVNGNLAEMTNMVEGNITNQYPLTKIRNYYRMGDGILDGYPIIQDQTSPNLAHIPTTNLVTYSENFSLSWQKNDSQMVLASSITDPFGTQKSYKLQTLNCTNQSYSNVTITSVVGKKYSFSVYAKKGDYDYVSLVGLNPLTIHYFNLANGTATSSGGITPRIYNVGNGWFRCEVTLECDNTSKFFGIYLAGDSGNISLGSVANGNGLYVTAAQIEEQSQATAYIKSDGIAAVRKATTTNLITYSEDFNNAIWSKVAAGTGIVPIVTSDYSLSPIGTQTADRIQFNLDGGTSSSDTSYITTGLSLGTINASLSIYLKTNDSTTKDITLRLGASLFDYNVTVTSEWKRFSLSGNTNVDRVQLLLYGNQNSQTADLSVWGVQVEQQTQTETYAPTFGLPVTIDLFTENNYGTMTNMSANDIVEDTP